MRLKAHREDVKWLDFPNANPMFREIQKRYSNLIRAYEDYLKDMGKYGMTYGKYDKRVLKDAEK